MAPKADLLGKLAIVVLGIAISTASGNEAGAETLGDALAATIANNPGLAAQRARTRATHLEVPIARAGYLPKVGASGAARAGNSDQRLNSDSSGFGDPQGPDANWSAGYSLWIDQPLFDGFKTANALKEASAIVEASEQDLLGNEQAVLLSAVTAYVDVVRDRAIREQREHNVRTLAAEVAAAKQRFEKGDGSKTDIAQAGARHADAIASLVVAKSQAEESRARYEQIIGTKPGNLVEAPSPDGLLPRSVEAAIGEGLEHHPAISAARSRDEASQYTIGKIRGEQMPYVALRGSNEGTQFSSGTSASSLDTSVTARVVVPLFDGGVTSARIQQAKELSLGRRMDLQDTKSQVGASVRAAWARLAASKQEIALRRASVEANRTALTGIREEQRHGIKGLIDVLNAEQELVEAKVKQIEAQRNLVRSGYEMLAVTGRLTVSALERPTARLAAEAPSPGTGSWRTEIKVAKVSAEQPSSWLTSTSPANAE